MADSSFLATRLDRDAVPLAIGDLIALIVLLTIGALNHSTVEFLFANPLYLLEVYAPFLIGWILVAPLIGAYSAGAVETAKSSVRWPSGRGSRPRSSGWRSATSSSAAAPP